MNMPTRGSRSDNPKRLGIALTALFAAVAYGAVGTAEAALTCESLTSLSLPHTTIAGAESIPAGSFTTPDGSQLTNLPASCRVVGFIKPTSDSNIGFEVWMPKAGWNQRFTQIGNGGLGGGLILTYLSVPSMLQRGYAVAGTDNGHLGGLLSGDWAVGHPEKVTDLAWRAVHETSVVSKQVISAFYGKRIRYSYFQGCSTGGKEAGMEAQRFPGDFDGILAGAAAYRYIDLVVRFIWDARALSDDPASYIPTSKLPAIQAAVLKKCDSIDGVADGIVNDPRRCHFDPTVLLCTAGDNEQCLTAPQVAALKKIYAGPTNPRTGEQIIFGYEPSGETVGSFISYVTGQDGLESAVHFFFPPEFNKLVFGPNWDYKTFDFDRDVAFMHQTLDPIPFDANSPDLSGFRRRGGKLIQYHGWVDYSVAPREAIDYYERVIAAQAASRRHGRDKGDGKDEDDGSDEGDGRGKRSAALERTREFFRLFMVPGMDHCAGGPGPNAFGQILTYPNTPPAAHDAQHDILTALEQWVEQGIAPERIVATKYVNDDVTQGIKMQRPLCPYPEVAVYKRSGSTNDAANFVCRAPHRPKDNKED
jgi:hypothetical protein